MGVWKQHGNTVKIYHVALTFDGSTGVPDGGYIIFTQKNTLSSDGNSYHGTFTFTQYDNTNTKVTSFSGTTEGHRIDFNHPYTPY